MPAAPQPAELALPRITSLADVHAFLRDHFNLSKDSLLDLTTDEPWATPELWLTERILLRELEEAGWSFDDKGNSLRAMIRAVSWRTHERMTPTMLSVDAHVLLNNVLISGRQAKENNAFAKAIVQAIDQQEKGDAAKQALLAIELFADRAWNRLTAFTDDRLVTWQELSSTLLAEPTKSLKGKQTKKVTAAVEDLQRLRPLRDQLYFQFLYPEWFLK
ncbi:MAG: hypothetical protein Q7R83_03735 [bacterium]|nr:hypothetical protein [bacterium]